MTVNAAVRMTLVVELTDHIGESEGGPHPAVLDVGDGEHGQDIVLCAEFRLDVLEIVRDVDGEQRNTIHRAADEDIPHHADHAKERDRVEANVQNHLLLLDVENGADPGKERLGQCGWRGLIVGVVGVLCCLVLDLQCQNECEAGDIPLVRTPLTVVAERARNQ